MIRLVMRTSLQIPIEAPCIRPDNFARLSIHEISHLPIRCGNAVERLGDFFDLAGEPSDGCIAIEGDCHNVKWLGADMTGGELTINGPVGMHTGSAMCSGKIEAYGDADDWLGAEMRGGVIHVHGNGGNHCGAGYPGSRRGMRGGVIMIDGRSGDGTATAMRRGVIAVGGCGDFAGASMIAGSLFVFGPVGRYLGASCKRGTIVLMADFPELLPTFQFSCNYEPIFLNIYCQRLQSLGFSMPNSATHFLKYCGDSAVNGLGEILIANSRMT